MDSDTEVDAFYFESDHLPLRDNPDYSNALRTVAMLEACKIRVHKELEELEHAKKSYLSHPELLLEKIDKNEKIIKNNVEIRIPELPPLIGAYEYMLPLKPTVKTEPIMDEKASTVRGRPTDESKPPSYNKLWTCEEQRRLEQLLMEYPPERKEMHRYVKIAKALGNRTPQQVGSRIQKYFQKLHDAGMPIPGRIPKSRRRPLVKTKYMFRPSTFFPSYNLRVNMPEDAEFEEEEWRMTMHATDVKQEDTDATDDVKSRVSSPHMESDHKKRHDTRLYMLKQLREEKIMCGESYQPDPMAPLCDVCQVTATTLRRWHCRTCHIYLRQCADCLINQLLSNDFHHILHDIIVEE